MKKILFLNTVAKGGGAAYVAESLFRGCNNNPNNYNAFFAYGRGPIINKEKYFYFGNKIETLIHLFLVRFFGIEGYGTYFATQKLINYIRKEDFDIIHIHNLHGYYVNFFKLIKFLKKSGIKVIWTLHDEWLFTWLPAYSSDCDHCKTLIGKTCSNTYSYPKNYFPIFAKWLLKKKRDLFSKATFITLVSPGEWLLKEKSQTIFSKLKSYIITNGIDTNVFYHRKDKEQLRQKYNIPLNKKIIAFSANDLLQPTKGINFILDVANKLQKNTNLYFVGFGKGALDITDNIKLFGYVTQEKSAEILSLSDIYLFTSLIEVHPLVILQALATGLPVVAFDIIPLRKIITNEVGVLVPYGKVNKLIESLNGILNNELKLNKLSNNAVKIGRSFNQDDFYKKHFELYNNRK